MKLDRRTEQLAASRTRIISLLELINADMAEVNRRLECVAPLPDWATHVAGVADPDNRQDQT